MNRDYDFLMNRDYDFLLCAIVCLIAIYVGYFLPDPLLTFPPSDFGLEPTYYPNPFTTLKEIAVIGFIGFITIWLIDIKGDKKKCSKQ